MFNCHVEDICVGKKDSQDQDILEVYGRKSPDYAVYRTRERVLVQFADEPAHNAEQRRAMAPLNPVRGEINGLIDGWRNSDNATVSKRALRYSRRGGDALVVAFEEDVAGAKTILDAIKKDILDERIARARFEYLIYALGTALLAMAATWFAIFASKLDQDGRFIWHATSAGTLGAFFSIALGIRGRTILPDLQRTANNLDAILRIIIGVIAAAVLTALVIAKAVEVKIGGASPNDQDHLWVYILIVGFIAGFSERFVPDLLAKAAATAPTQAQTTGDVPKRPANARAGEPSAGNHPSDRAMARSARAAGDQDPVPEQADTDHCACDLGLPAGGATADVDLPAASGGVASHKPATGGTP